MLETSSSLSRYGGNLILIQLLWYHIFFFHNTLALTCILSSTLKAACKCTGFVHCTSSQHVQCLLRCCWARCPNVLNNYSTCWAVRRFHKGSCLIMAENLRMDDSETKKMLSRVELKVWPVSNLTQQDSTPLNRVCKCAQLVELNMLRASTVDKSSAFARSLKNETYLD